MRSRLGFLTANPCRHGPSSSCSEPLLTHPSSSRRHAHLTTSKSGLCGAAYHVRHQFCNLNISTNHKFQPEQGNAINQIRAATNGYFYYILMYLVKQFIVYTITDVQWLLLFLFHLFIDLEKTLRDMSGDKMLKSELLSRLKSNSIIFKITILL